MKNSVSVKTVNLNPPKRWGPALEWREKQYLVEAVERIEKECRVEVEARQKRVRRSITGLTTVFLLALGGVFLLTGRSGLDATVLSMLGFIMLGLGGYHWGVARYQVQSKIRKARLEGITDELLRGEGGQKSAKNLTDRSILALLREWLEEILTPKELETALVLAENYGGSIHDLIQTAQNLEN